MKNELQKGAVIIYESSSGPNIQVKLKQETVWLDAHLIAKLFNVQRPAIVKHIHNIYNTGELKRRLTCSIMEQVTSDRKVRKMNIYNLDVIISVGYRVNSQKATQFRIWANKIVKQYLTEGYVINQKRILEAGNRFQELREAVLFLQKQSQKKLLRGQETEILSLLADYSKTLSLLEKYDKGKLKEKRGKRTKFVMQHEDCSGIIVKLKKELAAKKEASNLFGREKDNIFKGIIGNLYQTFSKKELYPSLEDKASHLLYLVIKDHPFTDGNKRIASFLFIYFLDRTNYLYKKTGERKINDNALTALALLIAVSDPKEKEMMIKIIKSLITK